jgi:hypothetical protein
MFIGIVVLRGFVGRRPALIGAVRRPPADARPVRSRRSAVRRAILAGLAVLALSRVLPAQEAGLLISPGKLSKAHAAYGNLDGCVKCHTSGTRIVDPKCLDCHEELARRIAAGRGFHKDKKTGCSACHPDHQGSDFPLIDWKPKAFDHVASGYLLTGRHAAVQDCEKCHNPRTSPSVKSGISFLIRDTRCQACHEDVHKGQFKQSCDACHALDAPFKDVRYDHDKAAYRPKGAHQSLACEKCHPGKKWTGLKFAGCADCHRDRHTPSFGTACEKCHTDAAWKVGAPDHAKTKFPLTGKHLELKCEKCHTNGRLGKLPGSGCRDCHKNDPHRGQFSGDCGSCHDATSFKKAAVNHDATRYPLTGKHANVACAKCHTAAPASTVIRYRPLAIGCVDCHRDVHRGQFAKSCEACHSTRGFDLAASGFVHDRDSSYRLEGAHAAAKCEACHKTEKSAFPAGPGEAVRYRPVPTACRTCHVDEHGGQLGLDCAACHTTVHFKPAPGFSHDKTRYPLTGFHEAVGCDKCHPRPEIPPAGQARTPVRYKPLGVRCADCHKPAEHAATEFPLTGKHADVGCGECHTSKTPRLKRSRPSGAAAPSEQDCQSCHRDPHGGHLTDPCASCHTPAGWTATARAFHKVTPFPLKGRHLLVPCGSCHLNGAIKGTPKGCYDCHWIRRQDDPYRTRLGSRCEDCHTPVSWTAVSWDHGAQTGMPLNAQHRTLGCDSCHKDRMFQGTSSDCYACHRRDYDNAQNPNHVTAGFSTTCATCHRATGTSWTQGTLNHASTFALVGVHATQPCAACHVNNVYKGTPRDCYGCHKMNYDQAKSPNHAASGFSTMCETCHRATDASWTQGTLNHTWFPISSGRHAGNACSACHTDAANFKVFTCLTCHPRSSVDSHHRSVSGYVYNSQNCYSCHPQGSRGQPPPRPEPTPRYAGRTS